MRLRGLLERSDALDSLSKQLQLQVVQYEYVPIRSVKHSIPTLYPLLRYVGVSVFAHLWLIFMQLRKLYDKVQLEVW